MKNTATYAKIMQLLPNAEPLDYKLNRVVRALAMLQGRLNSRLRISINDNLFIAHFITQADLEKYKILKSWSEWQD